MELQQRGADPESSLDSFVNPNYQQPPSNRLMMEQELADIENQLGYRRPEVIRREVPEPSGRLEKIAFNPVTQGVLGAGDALVNLQKQIYSTLTGSPYEPTVSGGGFGYEMGKFAGEVAPYVVASPASLPARMGFDVAMGALTSPEDVMGGAKEAAAWSAALESLSPIAKGIGKVTAKMNKKDVIDKISKEATEEFSKQAKEAGSLMNESMQAFGDSKISTGLKQSITGLGDELKIGSDIPYTKVKKMYQGFKNTKNPTIEQMQKLKSQVSAEQRGIKGTDVFSREQYQKLDYFKNSLNDAITSSLNQLKSGSGDTWRQGNDMYAQIMQGFKDEKVFKDLFEKGKQPSKNKLNEAMKNLLKAESEGKTKNEFLAEIAQKYTKEEDIAKLLEGAYRGAGALTLGSFDPLLGAVGATRALIPSAATQESMERILPKIYGPARQAAKGLAISRDNIPYYPEESQ